MHAIDTSNRARTDLKQFPMSTFAYPRLVALDVNKSILSVQLFQKSTWSTVHFASGRPTEFLVGTARKVQQSFDHDVSSRSASSANRRGTELCKDATFLPAL